MCKLKKRHRMAFLFLWLMLVNAQAELLIESELNFGRIAVTSNDAISSVQISRNGRSRSTNHIHILKKGTPGVYTFTDLPPYTVVSLNADVPAYSASTMPGSQQFILRAVDMPSSIKSNAAGTAQFSVGGILETSGLGANNEDLVVSARYESNRHTTAIYDTRLFSLKFDGSEKPVPLMDKRKLRSSMRGSTHLPQYQDNVIDWLRDDPEHILVQIDIDHPNLPDIYKVNIESGMMSLIERGKRSIRSWFTDQQGNVRVGKSLSYKTGEVNVYLREEDNWDVLFSYNSLEDKGIYPLGFGLNPDTFYYKMYKGDTLALYRMTLSTRQAEVVLHHDNYDVDGGLIYSESSGEAIGVYDSHSPRGEFYWDDRNGALLAGLNAAMSDYTNTLIGFSRDESIYILYSESDTSPGFYSLGNRQAGTLEVLFFQYPELEKAHLSEHELVTYETRDGQKIEGYLSLPVTGQAPYPTVIMPHGGPGSREYEGFSYWTSYMNNKGYAVFRPNFRGSVGYGYDFAQAQMQSWGLAMQDDITDAANWLIDKQTANPEKICIVGGSYGGYAALMATAKTPELFTCAVSFAGISDLERLLISRRKFVNYKFAKKQIGNDSDDLEKRSPITFVEKIKTPILILHGDEDRVVDVYQSRIMANALEDAGKVFRYVELKDGDHYLSIQKNRTKVFSELDAFLTEYLGN